MNSLLNDYSLLLAVSVVFVCLFVFRDLSDKLSSLAVLASLYCASKVPESEVTGYAGSLTSPGSPWYAVIAVWGPLGLIVAPSGTVFGHRCCESEVRIRDASLWVCAGILRRQSCLNCMFELCDQRTRFKSFASDLAYTLWYAMGIAVEAWGGSDFKNSVPALKQHSANSFVAEPLLWLTLG